MGIGRGQEACAEEGNDDGQNSGHAAHQPPLIPVPGTQGDYYQKQDIDYYLHAYFILYVFPRFTLS